MQSLKNIQISKPGDKKWRHNDVITKTMENNGKMRASPEKTKYISFERFQWELSKNETYIEFEPLCQKLWEFISSFTMTTHQILSCRMTLAASFENLYFKPNSELNFRKVTKVRGNWLDNKRLHAKMKCL